MPRGAPDWFYGAPQKTLLQVLREANAFGRLVDCGAEVGKISVVQLWNHNGSGVGTYIERVEAFTTATSSVYVARYNTRLSSDFGTGKCKKADAPESQLRCYTGTFAAYPGHVWYRGRSINGAMATWQPLYIWLAENTGAVIYSSLLNSAIYAAFNWFEFVDY